MLWPEKSYTKKPRQPPLPPQLRFIWADSVNHVHCYPSAMLILPIPLFHGVVNILFIWRFRVYIICSMDIQHGHATWTFSMNMQHGHGLHAAWCSTDMQHGHEAWTCSMGIWTFNMDMQHGHSARTCSMDMQPGHAAKTWSKDIWQGHAAWTCSMDMQHGHAAKTGGMETKIFI